MEAINNGKALSGKRLGMIAATLAGALWVGSASAQTDWRGQAEIQQFGRINTANIEQHYGSDNSASIYQSGEINEARILQVQARGATLYLQQIGTNNYTYAQQRNAEAPGPVANISTAGSGNQVYVIQNVGSSGHVQMSLSGEDNQMSIYQAGAGNHQADVRVGNSRGNIDQLEQVEVDEHLRMNRQNTDYSRVDVLQEGSSTSLLVEQLDSYGVRARVAQRGYLSMATVRQSAATSSTASLSQRAQSTATIEQTNVNSVVANVQQSSPQLAGYIYQTGGSDLAVAEIEQAGEFNNALIEQSGAMSSEAFILQTGELNYAEMVQAGTVGSTARIDQSGNGFTRGAFYATINQSGNDHVASIQQM